MTPDLETILTFAAAATASAVIVEALAIRKSHAEAELALGSFRYSRLTPVGRRYAARVARAALELGRALGGDARAFAREWLAERWERANVRMERPVDTDTTDTTEDTNADD